MTDDITPIEAGLEWLINSKEEFIGREPLMKQKAEGAPGEMIAFELKEKGIPRENYRIIKGSEDIGRVTSGVYSPLFEKGIGLALVKAGELSLGDSFSVEIRKKLAPAVVVQRPFYKYKGLTASQ